MKLQLIIYNVFRKLATEIKCFCLFATHYHELTQLESLHPNVIVNSHAEASVLNDQLVLLHKIVPGPATQSLGLHVARLAGLPESVIKVYLYIVSNNAALVNTTYRLNYFKFRQRIVFPTSRYLQVFCVFISII